VTRGPYALAVAVAALCVLASVTYAIHDPDIWQHLVVGRTIWQTHAIPHTQIWTWPTYGVPDVLPSWLFRAALWPFYEAGGTFGLFVWRWLSTLGAFALMWLATRRMGATGVAPLLMLVWCALFWRQRSQMRPETFAALLLAAQVLLLETRRARAAAGQPATFATSGPLARLDLAWALVPIALVWANAHISYYLGFVIGGAYLLDDLFRPHQRRRPGALVLALAGAAAASFVNPFGWRALAQPLEYFTVWRHEPVYQTIGELAPTLTYWDVHLRDGLFAWVAVLVLGALWRWRTHGFDRAQAVLLAVCLVQAFGTHRFLGYAALTLAPFAARDMAAWLGEQRWPPALAAPLSRAALVAASCVALTLPTLLQPLVGLSYGWVPTLYPERAADWIERHGVRGRAFNVFAHGGYLLHRFHPERDRLPFMDIHQAGTKEIRHLYAWGLQDRRAWGELDRRYRFDWVVLNRVLPGEPDLADFLDADSTWALVFADDAAALWLRRDGSCAALARDSAFATLPGGTVALGPLGQRAERDSAYRRVVAADFERALGSSPYNARAHTLAGNLAMIEERWADARAHYDEALRQQPTESQVFERQGLARLYAGDPAAALASFRALRRAEPKWKEADLREGQALARMGRRDEARKAWKRSLARHPELTEARDSLETAR
jgi:Flp pilus assembly protein TadD